MKTWIGRKAQCVRYRESSLVLPEQNEHTSSILRAQRQEAVARAAHAAHVDGRITRIHVVLNERPPYREIAGYRQVAEAQDLAMTVDGSGTVSMWRHDQTGLQRKDGKTQVCRGEQL